MTSVAQAHKPVESLLPVLERKRLIDGVWVVCLGGVLAAVTLPWFLHALDINLVVVAAAVFAYIVMHLTFSAATDRLRSSAGLSSAMRVMVVTGVVFLACLWHLVGGLQNPMFLAVFTLPVIMSGLMMTGGQALLTALTSVVLVTAMVMIESADLRWYLGLLHFPYLKQAAETGAALFPPVDAVAGFSSTPTYEFTLLVMFTAVQITVAFLSQPMALLLVRANGRLEMTNKMLTEVQGLFHAVLRAEPEPAVILYADSGQVVQASDSFFKRMLVRPSEIAGRALFEVVQFDDVDRVTSAFKTSSGELPFCVYRVHGEKRVANISFYATEHQGLRYFYVGFQEVTELYHLQAAFDAVDDPLMVFEADQRLHYANRAARDVFGELYFGQEVASASALQSFLHDANNVSDAEGERHLVIDGQPYDIHQLPTQLPGDTAASTIVWLHCVAKEKALFEQAVRDPLTGAYNRRYFQDALGRHVGTHSAGRPLACAYFDLDDFKPINDRLGHAAGDAALVGFVTAVKKQLRAVDILARLGGDEFAVIFVNCDLPIAENAIERIRTALSTEGWPFEGVSRPLKFSAGLAACQPDDTVTTLLERTDKAVYAAKAAGKGRSATRT
jgi:diguanylate cyclase (GGDEF)-like protein